MMLNNTAGTKPAMKAECHGRNRLRRVVGRNRSTEPMGLGPVLTHLMNAVLLLTPVFGLLTVACNSGPARDNSVSLVQAKEYLARIRPEMTLEDVRRAVPHVSERVDMFNHGGLDYLLELSREYHIGLRVSHSGKHGPSDYEQNDLDLHSQQEVTDHYGHNLINAPPFLQDRTGRTILSSYQSW
jgi:hypothetical protein